MVKSYQDGKVYGIYNTVNNLIYVGSTVQALCHRFQKHKCNSRESSKQSSMRIYQAFRKLGIDKFYIELIENYPCNSVEELRQREGHWIRHFQSYKPDMGYNYQIAGRPRKEKEEAYRETHKEQRAQQWKEWYAKNKDKVEERKKEYRKDHKEDMSIYNKEYAQKNKDKIHEQRSLLVMCECGEEVKKMSMRLHKKSKKHLDKLSSI